MRADMAADISAIVSVFAFDDIRAQIGKMLCAERSRTVLLDGDNPDAGQEHGLVGWARLRIHKRFLSISCLAMMILCISFVPSPIISNGASR